LFSLAQAAVRTCDQPPPSVGTDFEGTSFASMVWLSLGKASGYTGWFPGAALAGANAGPKKRNLALGVARPVPPGDGRVYVMGSTLEDDVMPVGTPPHGGARLGPGRLVTGFKTLFRVSQFWLVV